jgi:hypothetical protein
MRTSVVRGFALGMITGSFLTAGLITAIPAKADDALAYSYAARYGGAICLTLDEHPTTTGILGIGAAITEDGLTAYEAGQAIFYAVDDICPRHMGLLRDFANSGGTWT